ncbi:MAG: ubiquinol-cytochrome c reductase iron-sulfur subunit [Deltaproteobacteria bacterium]|jgi:cytochrome b6-f complex iron-sulfur subunit|nr:ubiquinol-cytochrome c reductase iron-sulfur subunit [Deltaproteobacteria bacterium]
MPTKTREKKSETEPNRRSFLNILWIILGGVALAEFVAVTFAFLRPRKLKAQGKDSDSIITAGAVERFEPNSVTAFVRGKFYLARLEDGGFLALSRTCTHLGCSVPWIEKEMKFACPCHGSAFDITGSVIEAPAPRALDIYPIAIENNIIKVDILTPIKRNTFHKDQVTYLKKKA